jgi:hypothetical protein
VNCCATSFDFVVLVELHSSNLVILVLGSI